MYRASCIQFLFQPTIHDIYNILTIFIL